MSDTTPIPWHGCAITGLHHSREDENMEQDETANIEDVVDSTDAIVDQLVELNKTMDEIGKVLGEISRRLMSLEK